MKSLAELAAIRAKMQNKVVIREGAASTRVVVGMATCGIAAGARPVLSAFVDGVNKGGFDVIEFQHLLTQYKITAHKGYVYDNWSSYAYMTITIDHIGTTKITPPWK